MSINHRHSFGTSIQRNDEHTHTHTEHSTRVIVHSIEQTRPNISSRHANLIILLLKFARFFLCPSLSLLIFFFFCWPMRSGQCSTAAATYFSLTHTGICAVCASRIVVSRKKKRIEVLEAFDFFFFHFVLFLLLWLLFSFGHCARFRLRKTFLVYKLWKGKLFFFLHLVVSVVVVVVVADVFYIFNIK